MSGSDGIYDELQGQFAAQPLSVFHEFDDLVVVVALNAITANLESGGTAWPTLHHEDIADGLAHGAPLCTLTLPGQSAPSGNGLLKLRLGLDETGRASLVDNSGRELDEANVSHLWSTIGEFVTWACQQPGYGAHMLSLVPIEKRTQGLCMDSVRADGRALAYVPHNQVTPEMARAALDTVGAAIRSIPPALLDMQMCLQAVRMDPTMMVHVPTPLLTRAVCLEAVRQDPRLLGNVPPVLRSVEMCVEAASRDADCMRHVPAMFVDMVREYAHPPKETMERRSGVVVPGPAMAAWTLQDCMRGLARHMQSHLAANTSPDSAEPANSGGPGRP